MPSQSTINLVAVYRNHDYFNKALGNFVGLARLLDFLCTQAGKKPGQITCHSVHYYIDKAKSTRQLLNNINNGHN
jgi:thymidylate synthase